MEKLIRDEIPGLASEKGEVIPYRHAGPDEYPVRLREKVLEELAEFLKDENPEEMGDMLDVLEAVAENRGWDFNTVLSEPAPRPLRPPDADPTLYGSLVQAVSVFLNTETAQDMRMVVAQLRTIAQAKGWEWGVIEDGRKEKTRFKGGFRKKIVATFADKKPHG